MIISGLPVSYEGIELHLQVEDVGPLDSGKRVKPMHGAFLMVEVMRFGSN